MRQFLFAFALLFLTITNARSISPLKILILKVDESGTVTDGQITIRSEKIADYIRERLFMNYKGTGKMYDKIELLVLSEKVHPDFREVLAKEIAMGQKSALSDLCLDKYRKPYDDLSSKQQEKIHKYFPVLFQADFVTMATP